MKRTFATLRGPGLVLLFLLSALYVTLAQTKPRTIVTTDGEIDDVDSFIRMLLYANEFSIEGLIYSSSMWHYKGDGKGTKFISEMKWTKERYGERTELRWPGTNWMQELIAEYEKIYPKLSQHADGFPSADHLSSLIRVGNIDFEGAMEKDTEGSDFIKEKLLDDNMEPIYLQVWGGTNTIARALKSIEDEYKQTDQWAQVYKKVCDKSIIYAILDQDATYRKYIAGNWPDVKIYYNSNQFWCFAYPWKRSVPEPIQYSLEGKFMGENIINDHGPLNKKYYSYGDGQKQAGDPEHTHGNLAKANEGDGPDYGKYDFISEGDSPAFLHLVDVGLGNLENPHFGGWGGRLIQSEEQANRWEDGENAADYNPYTKEMDKTYPQTRWVETLQNDFAARADWCIMDYEAANHAPSVMLKHPNKIIAAPGQKIKLKGKASDPDKDKLNYNWWQYSEVDTYGGEVTLQKDNASKTSFVMPQDIKQGETIHLILEVSDDHEFPMTRYQRVIIEAK
jgi:hypothetical protein